jgi:hypothetical protein
VKLDGIEVIKVEAVDWHPEDDLPIRQSTVLGRAVVDVAGGGRFHGLLLLPFVPFGELARPIVVVWERSTGRFAAIPIDRTRIDSHGARRSK